MDQNGLSGRCRHAVASLPDFKWHRLVTNTDQSAFSRPGQFGSRAFHRYQKYQKMIKTLFPTLSR